MKSFIKNLINSFVQPLAAFCQKWWGEQLLLCQYHRQKNDFQWKRGVPCPKARVEANGVVLGDKLYLFGGYETIGRVLDRCDIYDFRTKKWLEHVSTPKEMAQTHSGITKDDRYIYIVGGQVGPHCAPCSDRCFVFDTQTKTFGDFPSLPQARYVGVTQFWNGRIHVVGGSMQDRFSPATNHWSIAAKDGRALESTWREEISIPRGGMHRGAAIVGNALYVIGGSEGDVRPVVGDPQFKCDWRTPMENIHGEIYKLEAGANEWQRLADMPIKLGHTDTTVIGMENSILVFGGTETRIKCSNLVWRYDITRDRWEKIGSLPYHMKSTFAHYFNGHFYLITGQRARSIQNLRPYPLSQNHVWIAPEPQVSKIRKRIGVLPLGGKEWIAGVNYLQNIVRSTRLLPANERPEVFFICRATDNIQELAAHFNVRISDFHRFAYLASDSRFSKVRSVVASLRRGVWPRSLKRLVKDLRIDLFAPMMEICGKEIAVPWIGWIPDFQHKAFPEFFPKDELLKRDKYFRTLVDQAPHVIVSSQDAYKGLMKWFPTGEKKVSVFPFPFLTDSAWYAGDPRCVVEKFNLPEKFLMFPGQFWVHKNHEKLFEAVRILVQERGHKDILLVCSGRQHDHRVPEHFNKVNKIISANGLEPHIRLLGLIDRHDQIQLMRACAAIVQPSLFEGWCLMIEEARSLGKRIFLSDLDVHREQNPPHADYFDPHDAQALADLLEKNWPSLTPGVDARAEAHARELCKAAVLDLGRRFNQIVTKTLHSEVHS